MEVSGQLLDPATLPPGKEASLCPLVRSWVGPTAGLPRRRDENIRMFLKKQGVCVWTGFKWLRTTSGGLF